MNGIASEGLVPAPDAPRAPASGWQARLELEFERRADRTVLARSRHHGPLVVQRPFYPEDEVCHVYVVHPPGGVVAADELALDVRVGPGAHALLTTPAAGKFYRSEGPRSALHQSFLVDAGTLEWLPQENIYYPGAVVETSTTLHLRSAARVFAWEIGCFGLGAQAQPFATGEVHQCLDLHLDAKWLLCERQVLDIEAIGARWGLAGRTAVGTLVAYPAGERELEQARAVAGEQVLLGVTNVDGVLVCRALAHRADRLRATFVALWRALRPLMPGRAACAPRVWAT